MSATTIPGSERFSSRPIDPEVLIESLEGTLPVHTVTQKQIDDLDPLTYEVIRHRLWSVTNEMGETLKRMSGSPIVTDANDFDFAICDEVGQEVQVGLYNCMLAGAIDLAIYWTLQNRVKNPGINKGDMFLANDPWVGGGLHQNDVIVFQPIFHEGQLFGWTSAICHEPDLGGVGLGSFSPSATDVFSEALPTPPIKVVRDFEVQEDVADAWVRRSRVPQLVSLDLRAKVGANTVGRKRLLEVIEHYGADTVKAVMKRMMNDAEGRLRGKLKSLPDGTWSTSGYQDQSHEGDRGVHKIKLKMTKLDDHLTFDFTGTDEQAGVINCTYAGLRGGAMLAIMPMLADDIPWSAGGLMRCFDLIAEEGSIVNATYPAAVSRAPIGPAWALGQLVAECLSQMMDRTVEFRDRVQAACCGTHDTAVMAGLDQRGEVPVPFLNIVMDVVAAGYGARPKVDGMDTGGVFCIPMGRLPDVEMTEYLYPLMTLWRREEPDTGGPGRQRGGLSGSAAFIPYGTEVPVGLVVASAGKGVSQNGGLAGGYPGNTAVGIVARNTGVKEGFAQREVPFSLDALRGEHELQPCYGETLIAPGDLLYMHWQSGGGYGDPLLRDPHLVAHDLAEGKVTLEGAAQSYGVLINDGDVDLAATDARRTELRAERKARSIAPANGSGKSHAPGTGKRIDDNLVAIESGGIHVVACAHCGHELGDPRTDETLNVAFFEGPSALAGPHVTAHPENYVDAEVVFRQLSCPNCYTAIYSGVVPSTHTDNVLDLDRYVSF
ncbi:hydantoinase B/oxoprolinase family protein [Rhodococcus opacus]|uniref:Hydantoinase n=1 Tax=Rhodococcus opacus TaxID=37919 RepID=A0A2S8J726_RHOOP|nr:hydantoinase B/oxoprolinase family protein [Rhodococcus opacus]PQP22805.1 hydantoinase [Rhodococcus opacus]